MYCVSATLALIHCSIVGNYAPVGRALGCNSDGGNSASVVTVASCILWDGGHEIWNNDASTILLSYSDVWGGWPGTGNIDADPLFVDPDGPDNDPETWEDNDCHLQPGSLCIESGDPDFAVQPGETDMDGEFRIWDADGDGEARVDMGADEYGSYVYGDLNCDGVVNGFDIDPFVLAITDTGEYETMYPNCNRDLADINADGVVNAFDIDPFVELLTGG